MIPTLIPLLAPIVLALVACVAFQGPAFRPARTVRLTEGAALVALASAALSAALVIAGMAAPSALVHLDAVSAILLVLVSFVGWVVLRYSGRYLDGEARQGPFLGWMSITLASVLLLVQAGHLAVFVGAWVSVGIGLHQLLLFYAERPAARRAAQKKVVLNRIGDGALILAAGLLAYGYGTGDIAAILEAAQAGQAPVAAQVAGGLFAISALIKSAQFPVHGWLTEVMEAPTPVSALLHAGVINAGGVLLIRFADVMLLVPGVLALLAMIGGATALIAGAVMLTQSAVKTSLAWSTIAQMGFMILQCGLALFPLALLHIVAHSLYKAHAFLASGTAVEAVAQTRRPGPVAVPSVLAVVRAFGLALLVYAAIVVSVMALMAGAGMGVKSPQALALGAILIFGVAYLFAQGLADAAPGPLTRRIATYAAAASLAYVLLQTLADALTSGALPATPIPGPLEWAVIGLALFSFGTVAVVQALLPLWAGHPSAAGLRVHLANGLYANALLDRLLGNWSRPKAS